MFWGYFRKPLAIVLMLGGVYALVFGGLRTLLTIDIKLGQLVAAAFIATFYCAAVFAGIQLWRNTEAGRIWSLVLFVIQIPVLSGFGVIYRACVGAGAFLTLRTWPGDLYLNIELHFGSDAWLFFGANTTSNVIGINLLALLAVIVLARSNTRRNARAAGSTPGVGEGR
jgi:hypothetical protein